MNKAALRSLWVKHRDILLLGLRGIGLLFSTFFFGTFLAKEVPALFPLSMDSLSGITTIIFALLGYTILVAWNGFHAFDQWQHRQVLGGYFGEYYRGESSLGVSKIINEFETNPKAFVQKYFNQSPSFLKHYLNKAFDCGEINRAFVLNSLSIPRRKSMNLDLLKTVMNSVCNQGNFFHLPQMETDGFYDRLSRKFENYDDHALAQLFCRPYSVLDYQDFCELEVTAARCKSIKELLQVSVVHQVHNPALLRPIKNNSFEYRVCVTGKDYQDCSIMFSNCIYSSYLRDRSCDVVMVFKNDAAYACLTLNPHLKMRQCLGVSNRKISMREEERIYQSLWDAVKT